MSSAQFGTEIATDRIERLIDEARSAARRRQVPGSVRFAQTLRRVADRLDPR